MTPYAEVIGDPIAQSKSPLIHGFWLTQLGIDAGYRATHVPPEKLGEYFAERRADPAWRGCNVTVPHKLAALDHVADPGDVRGSIGAINTVFRGDGGDWIGTNTDAAGFHAPIAGLDLGAKPVVVIGAGGAARAILFALSKLGVGRVTILNRNVLKAAGLLASFGLKGDALPLTAPLPAAKLLVNASTLGMTGQPPLTIDLTPLLDDAVVYDAVYAPIETPLLAQAHDRGLDTVDGLEMLVGQAALAFELFFGAAPPRDRDDELRAALLK
ncbi:shikimate dehydrogenase family protein [Sphingomonas sp. Leaf25]|uniref:shikimate dehydrogenase family protein n=1 Tax=Sphingomonas sp. Leaf25 TaxID=1735692 RepID=UPI0006FC8F06|nr:shikimate dehydrogenase [Sphingomonas sp. Leaf25]KQM96403.1 shikimate dehydrogenase [Sphingomonas sp. Leaf25]